MIMNMDFTKPNAEHLELINNQKIDLKDPLVIEEFKIHQEINLEEIRRLNEGKKCLTETEI